jgi:glycerol-3-phosphate dehydrogenase
VPCCVKSASNPTPAALWQNLVSRDQAGPAADMGTASYDLVVIGGGINGCGIAADAAGRGLKVLLAEKGDLGGATSSASSKLIHGGLRYLEHYEFRLVREALAEREVLLRKAPHIVWPLRFILPHVPGLRPAWMIRAGLFLYDHLYRRSAIPASRAVDLGIDPAGRPLRPEIRSGFAYWDCWVDDARLVILNARAAADRGAEILPRCKVNGASTENNQWCVELESAGGTRRATARALVNAAGPWTKEVAPTLRSGRALQGSALQGSEGSHTHLRLVKGSHIVLPRIAGAEAAYLLQSPDRRVVFALPFEERFTIVGTTDVPYSGDPGTVHIDPAETSYLLDLAGRFFKVALRPDDVIWSYSGVRPLHDDKSGDPSAVTRDYRLDLAGGDAEPPLLTVTGGKVTTYRRLAEEGLERLQPYLPGMRGPWTAAAPLPGGDMPASDFDTWLAQVQRRLPAFEGEFLRRLARRHGTLALSIIGDARGLADMGQSFGAGGLTEREVVYLKEREWAATPDDVLWRRTKAGLHLIAPEREAAAEAIARLL